jgi:hypothetical protein
MNQFTRAHFALVVSSLSSQGEYRCWPVLTRAQLHRHARRRRLERGTGQLRRNSPLTELRVQATSVKILSDDIISGHAARVWSLHAHVNPSNKAATSQIW